MNRIKISKATVTVDAYSRDRLVDETYVRIIIIISVSKNKIIHT